MDSVETEASTEDAIAAGRAATERKSQEQITQACGEITKKNKKKMKIMWPRGRHAGRGVLNVHIGPDFLPFELASTNLRIFFYTKRIRPWLLNDHGTPFFG